jgi:hypothetical protein
MYAIIKPIMLWPTRRCNDGPQLRKLGYEWLRLNLQALPEMRSSCLTIS